MEPTGKDMDNQQKNNIRIGISVRIGLAIGAAGLIIALVSFDIATYLNKVLTIATALDRDLEMTRELINGVGEADMLKLLKQQRKIYDALPEDALGDPTDESYQSRFDSLRVPEYEKLLEQLDMVADVPELMWADLRFLDEKRGRYVYLMNSGAKADGTYGIGYWEDVEDPSCNEVVAKTGTSLVDEEMDCLPKWVGKLAESFPPKVRYVPCVIDHLFEIDAQSVLNRFCILYPLHDPDSGELIGYLSVGEFYKNYQSYNWAFALAFIFAFVPYFIAITLVARVLVKRDIVSPIQQLAKAAVEYGAQEDMRRGGDHFKKVDLFWNDEILLLRDSMADMDSSLVRYMDELTQMTAQEERIKAEMDMSAQIQKGMLPQAFEDNGRKRDYTISASMQPAKSVGGDFYDFFEIDDERTGIVMADVSGKGMPAALIMMMAKTILGTVARGGGSAEDIMRRANRQLCDNNPEMLFVTIWFGIYHETDRTITYVNAGHDYPAVYRHSEGKFTLVKEEGDFVMGVMSDAEFNERKLMLEPGDKLFLYTDGIPEAHDADGEMYGEERMLVALDKCAAQTQEAFLSAVDAEVRGFIGEAEQFDDMTMLLLEV